MSVVEFALPILREAMLALDGCTVVEWQPERRGWKGIAQAILDEAGLTFENGLVSVPYRDSDASVLRMRFRAGTRAWWGPGEGMHLLGLETLPTAGSWLPRYGALILTEGESDCLSAREHLRFHCDDVATRYWVVGVPGARSFQPEWRLVCEPFDVVYAVGDGDDAGRAFTFSVSQHVPWARPVACPEGRDLRDLLQQEGLDALLSLLRAAGAQAEGEWLIACAPDLLAVDEP